MIFLLFSPFDSRIVAGRIVPEKNRKKYRWTLMRLFSLLQVFFSFYFDLFWLGLACRVSCYFIILIFNRDFSFKNCDLNMVYVKPIRKKKKKILRIKFTFMVELLANFNNEKLFYQFIDRFYFIYLFYYSFIRGCIVRPMKRKNIMVVQQLRIYPQSPVEQFSKLDKHR